MYGRESNFVSLVGKHLSKIDVNIGNFAQHYSAFLQEIKSCAALYFYVYGLMMVYLKST